MNKGWIILKKQEMTSIWINDLFIPVTLLKLVTQEIVRYKTLEKDWYQAVVVWTWKKELTREKGVKVKYHYLTEFYVGNDYVQKYSIWSFIDLWVLEWIEKVDLYWISKWKWFQWVVRRHNFAWGPETHGSKFHRRPWSMGNRKPRRVNKGHPLPWHMWLDSITLKNVKIIDIFTQNDLNLIAVKGPVPWAYNGLLKIYL